MAISAHFCIIFKGYRAPCGPPLCTEKGITKGLASEPRTKIEERGQNCVPAQICEERKGSILRYCDMPLWEGASARSLPSLLRRADSAWAELTGLRKLLKKDAPESFPRLPNKACAWGCHQRKEEGGLNHVGLASAGPEMLSPHDWQAWI